MSVLGGLLTYCVSIRGGGAANILCQYLGTANILCQYLGTANILTVSAGGGLLWCFSL